MGIQGQLALPCRCALNECIDLGNGAVQSLPVPRRFYPYLTRINLRRLVAAAQVTLLRAINYQSYYLPQAIYMIVIQGDYLLNFEELSVVYGKYQWFAFSRQIKYDSGDRKTIVLC